MLVELSIRDIVLIDRLEIGFRRGLTVMTGETGAGKSILLDALTLALGGRGDASLVRHGETQGQVTAVFDVPADHPARRILAENAIDPDGDVILRRIQAADGRTRAFVNDQAVGVSLMRAIGAALVEIHGQHDDRALVDPAAHRELLDAFGALEAERRAVAEAWSARKTAEAALARHRTRVEAARREVDYLRAAVEELTDLGPEPGEEERLAAIRTAMMKVEKVAGDLNDAAETLNGSGSPIPEIAGLWKRLERKAAEAPHLITPAVEALGRALDALEEARTGLEHALTETAFDPRQLEKTEERLFALRAAARKHQVPCDDLPALAERMAADLAEIDAGEERLAVLAAEVEAAREAYDAVAAVLSERRRDTARALEAAVAAELPALKLERATFLVEMSSNAAQASGEGIDVVEFWVRTNPGTRPGPMMKVASGGELSRFLLALKVALADRGSAPTLVFDEIDTGVGGAVAEAIGTRLARLSHGVQVIAVTHAPQVAARAGGHLLIAKWAAGSVGEEERVATRVTPIEGAVRREEIARMLAGATITAEARAAAERLLAGTE